MSGGVIGAHQLAERAFCFAGRDVVVVVPASPTDLLKRALDEGAPDAAGHVSLPYWTRVWPSSLELARRLSREDLRGQRLVELGAGLAVPGLAAAAAGADVLVTDRDPDALKLAAASATRSGLQLRTATLDWSDPEGHVPFDWVVGAELLYDEGLAVLLARAIHGLLAASGVALVADPWFPMHDAFEAAIRRRGMAVRKTICGFDYEGRERVTAFFEVRHGDRQP